MKAIDLSSSVDKALISGKITPAEWMERKRKEIEKDVKKQFGSLKNKKNIKRGARK